MTEREFVEQIKNNKRIIHKVCAIYCQDLDSNDLMQDIIAETWKSLDKWKNSCKFNTWLYAIARNVCISTLRKKNKEPIILGLEDFIDTLAEVDNTPELIKQLNEAMRYNAVINSLDEPMRTFFEMYLHGVSYKEISDQTGINERSLHQKIDRIKKRLQLRYGNEVI